MKKYKEFGRLITFLVIFVLLCVAMGIRLSGLTSIDLWTDEALSTLISQSLVLHGEFHTLRYSDFVPSFHYQHKIWVFFPPLYYFLQAPFMLLKNILHPNIIARIPALLSSILLIIMLYFISKNLWKNRSIGLIAVLFGTFNGFQIYMSRSAETYSLLPAFLCIDFYFLLKALNKEDKKHWFLASAFWTISYYINQMALLFAFIWIVGFVVCCQERKYQQAKDLCVYCLLSVVLCLPWLFIQRYLFLIQTNQMPQSYISTGKLLRILMHYYAMLGNWVFVMFFLLAFGRILYVILNKNKSFEPLLVVWIFLPCVYFFSKTMWINPHHMFFVFPPVIIVTAYGAYHLFHFLIEKIGLTCTFGHSAYNAAFLLFFLTISALQIKFIHFERFAGAAEEFGKSDIVSKACDYIKKHYAGEIVIAPIGLSEAYYLNMFVYDKNKNYAMQKSFDLISKNDAWVFIGDNYFKLGRLDKFDLYVQKKGRLIMHSEPVKGFTDSNNELGYALYHIGKQDISGYNLLH